MTGVPEVGFVFWILAVMMIVSAFMVVSLKNIFHCALFLVFSLFSVAGIYIMLHAEFLAAAQVLIYVGAVAILMIFAIMLTSNLASKKIHQVNENALVSFFISLIFFISVCMLLYNTRVWRYAVDSLPENNVMAVGKALMTEYMLPFEVVSVLMLAAMIGAIVLARKERS
jgi:NADH-quinone oxidoreductase subunit J